MKQFGTGNEPFLAPNGDVAKGAPEELTRPTNQAFNSFYQTAKSIVEIAGNTLTPADGTNENPAQVGESVVKIAREQVGAYITTTGTADNYVASPTPSVNVLMAGLKLCVVLNVSSTGGQVSLTVAGNSAKFVKTIDTANGAKVNPAKLTAGLPYFLIYDGIDFVLANDSRRGQFSSDKSWAGSLSLAPQGVITTPTISIYCPFGGKIVPYSFLTFSRQNSGDAAIRNLIYINGNPHSQEQTFGSNTTVGGYLVNAGETITMYSEAKNIGTVTSSNSISLALSYIYIGGL